LWGIGVMRVAPVVVVGYLLGSGGYRSYRLKFRPWLA
jgi:hypothetical protein